MERQQDKQNDPQWRREQRINRRSTLISFIAIIGFVAITIPFFTQVKSPVEVQDAVEKTMQVAPLSLSAFYKNGDQELPLDLDHVAVGRDIVFSLSSIRPVHVSLAASIDDAEPIVLFHGAMIPPGPKRILEKHDQRYVFQFEKGQHKVKACLITASDHEYLQKKIDSLPQAWQQTRPEACLQLVASE